MSNASSSPTTDVPIEGGKRIPMATWGPLAALVVSSLSYVLSNAGASVVIIGITQALGWSTERIDNWLTSSVSAQFLFILLVESLTLGILWWFIRRRKGNLGMIGLGRRIRWGDLGQGVLGFLVYFGALVITTVLVQWLLPINVDQRQELGFDSYGQPLGALAVIFFSLVVLPPVTEEILFRGFLFSGLRKGMTVLWTVLVTSLTFGALHLMTGISGEGLLWIAGIDTFVLSLILCYLRLSTGALWSPMIVHAMKNGLAFVSIFIFHLS